jgi:hypothetical protein
MAIIVKQFFMEISVKKTYKIQPITEISRQIASLPFRALRSSGKIAITRCSGPHVIHIMSH